MKRFRKKEVTRSNSPSHLSLSDAEISRFAAELRDRTIREQRGQFLIEGVRSAFLAIEANALDILLFAYPAPPHARVVLHQARAAKVRLVPLAPSEIQHLAQNDDPQGVIGIASRRVLSLDEAQAQHGRWVVLESLRKPGNLGSILRCAEASGVQGIIAIGGQIDFFSAPCLRASMGSIWGQTLVRCSWQQAQAFKARLCLHWIGSAFENATQFDTAAYPEALWLWMGDERSGLSEQALTACDARVQIPMQGRVDSLNVAVATAILLYEMRRERGQQPKRTAA